MFAATKSRASNVLHEFSHRLVSTHSPEPVELSVQTLAANVETRKTVVKNRERFPMVSKTRFTRSLNITVPNGGEGTRPASRLRDRALRTPRACFSFPSPFYLLSHPLFSLPQFLSRHAQTLQRSRLPNSCAYPFSHSVSLLIPLTYLLSIGDD